MPDGTPPVDFLAGLDRLSRERLRGRSVLIAGAGNIGSPLASFVARCGVGRLTLVDRDRVETKNLRSQDFVAADVGRFKAEVLAERLRQRAPVLEVEAVCADLEDAPLGRFAVDLILGALDSRRARQVLVSEIAWPLGVPVIDGGVGEGWRGRVQTFTPGADAACLECTWGEADYRGLTAEYPCVPGAAAAAAPTAAPAFVGAATAAMMTAEAVRLLACAAASMSQEIAFDLFHRRQLTSRLRRAPRCRFDHQTVGETWPLGRTFASATVGDLLAVVAERSEGERVHLECRRGVFGGDGFGAARLTTPAALRARAAEPLAALGLTPHDRIRVRGAGAAALVRLDA
jgi:molybdopterin/thiamine biosynthesis adenylyltransferase